MGSGQRIAELEQKVAQLELIVERLTGRIKVLEVLASWIKPECIAPQPTTQAKIREGKEA
jgi:hypothetical protein